MQEFEADRGWLSAGCEAYFSQPIFSQPLRNQRSTSRPKIEAKSKGCDWLTGWLRMVGRVKCLLVGCGGFLRTPTATTQPTEPNWRQ